MKLFGNQKVVGLEFDRGTVRGVEMIKKGSSLCVSGYAKTPVSAEAIQEGVIRKPQEVLVALEKLWAEGKFRAKDVVMGISNQGVIIRFALFPKVTPNRLDNLIRFQAQDHLPVSLDSVVLDYDVIGTTSDGEREMLEVLLVAGRKEMLDGFLQVLNSAHLRPREIEVIPLTLLRFLPKTEQQVTAVIDIGEGTSNMLIADSLKPRLARMMLNGIEAAEKLVAATQEDVNAPVEPAYENLVLANNIQATIGFYQSHRGARPVEKIMLSGKGSQVKGLTAILENRLQLPVNVVNPLEALNLSFNGGQEKELAEFSVAFSLACRGWEG